MHRARLAPSLPQLLLVLLVLLARPAPANCRRPPRGDPPRRCPETDTRRPRLLEARVTACRQGDDDLRQAFESFRADHDIWVRIPLRPPGGQVLPARPYDELVELRVRRIGGVIVRLEPSRYRELGEPKAPGGTPAATAWARFDDVKAREYFLRLGHPDCAAAARGTAYFVTADGCCDTVPPADDACLLALPAVKSLPKELQGLAAGD